MGIKLDFGGSKSKSSSTSTSNLDRTTSPIVPDWISGSVNNYVDRIGDLSNINPYSLSSPASPLELRAAAGAQDLSGMPWNFDAAAQYTKDVAAGQAPRVQAASSLDNLDAYMSPNTGAVVDTALNDFDQNAGRTRAQQSLDMAGANAFGGSGAAITRSLTEGELARARASTDANLRNQAFTVGAGLSGEDAGRRQEASVANANLTLRDRAQKLAAADQLGGLSTAYEANLRANQAAQAGIGAGLRTAEDQWRQAPYTALGRQVDMLSGLPLSLFAGQQTHETQVGASTGKNSSMEFGVSGSGNLKLSK